MTVNQLSHTPQDPRWLDNGRYEILRRLGEGGFGVVYHAFDHKMGLEVALKKLKSADAETHYRFKKEFRALADLSHPNLIHLYDLVADDTQCFFTMELIRGVEFLEYVQQSQHIDLTDLPPPAPPSSSSRNLSHAPSLPPPSSTPPPTPIPSYSPSPLHPHKPPAHIDNKPPAHINNRLSAHTESASALDLPPPFTQSFEPPPFPPAFSNPPASPKDPSASTNPSVSPRDPPASAKPTKPTNVHFRRLLQALSHLAQGVAALHRYGLLHRDLKPSNVLVTPEGRVVILDFGLVAELRKDAAEQSMQIAGTPAYMSPEQALHQPLTEACDWYSVGVILYQSLTGRLPFEGSAIEILGQKHSSKPTDPQHLVSGVPVWLSQLCLELLDRDPNQRPQGAELLELLGAQALSIQAAQRSTQSTSLPLIGRHKELQRLRRLFHQTLPTQATAVLLEGNSGVGKSHLARLALSVLQNEAPSMLFHARCYKQESIPYKAVDAIIGQISHYLRMLPPSELRPLIPEGIESLAHIFPVFRRIRTLQLDLRPKLPLEPSEQRRQAFATLRELLRRLSLRRKLIFWIDDLQWGDVDSAALLIELLRPPEAPALMFLGCFRSEDSDSSPFLQKFSSLHSFFQSAFPLERMALEGLPLSDAAELAALLFGPPAQPRNPLLLSLAKQSGGNPSLLEELVRYVQQHTSPEQREALLLSDPTSPLPSQTSIPPTHWEQQLEPILAGFTLSEVFKERYARLSPAQQALLEVLAVAGQPTARNLLLRTLDLSLPAADISQLRLQHLIRLRDAQEDEEIDLYHERIREILVALLEHHHPSRLKDIHSRLAHELSTEDTPDVKRLAIHLSHAGDHTSALGYTLQAAQDAESALAFGQATRWYKHALSLSPLDPLQERDILRALADALAHQGLGESAADAYLQAAARTQQLHPNLFSASSTPSTPSTPSTSSAHYASSTSSAHYASSTSSAHYASSTSPTSSVSSARFASLGDAKRLQQELRLQAATQLIRCGQLDRGLDTLSHLLRELRLRWSPSKRAAIWTWLQCRIRLFFHKLPDASVVKLLYRTHSKISLKIQDNVPSLLQDIVGSSHADATPTHHSLNPEQALRLRACRLVSMEVGLADPLQGMAFQAQYLLEAVHAKDPYHLALAYALEAAYSSFQGPNKQQRTEHLTDQALTLGKQLHHPHIIGTCYLTAGFAAFTQGAWRRAYDRCALAERILRQSSAGITWELSNCHIYQMNALLFMGSFRELERTLPVVLREAEERGDLYTQTHLNLGVAPRLLLAKDQPEQATLTIQRTLPPRSQRAFHLQHYIELINRGEIALYLETPLPFWRYLLDQWAELRRSLFLRIQFNRIELHHLRGRCALACAIQQPLQQRDAFLKEARRCAKIILKEGTRWGSPWALHLLAGADFLAQHYDQGLQHLTAAEVLLEDTDAHLYTHATMLARSLWLPHAQAQDLAHTALQWMQSQPIQAPLRLLQALLPGCLPLPA